MIPHLLATAATGSGALVAELQQVPPFAQMAVGDVELFAGAARPVRFAAGQTVLQPADGPVRRLIFVRRGAILGRHGLADLHAGGFVHEAGALFPTGALLGERAVTATYQALQDSACLEVDAPLVQALAATSPVWADFLARRAQQLLDLSRRALQAEQASQALAEQSLESPLSSLPRKPLVACDAQTALIDALRLMHDQRVGSVLALDADGVAVGILTRHDLLERVALRRLPDGTPLAAAMSSPVHTLDVQASAQEAALLMSRHGIRHVPLTEAGRVVSIVSESDLFALQRLSLRHIGDRLRHAADRATLVAGAGEIRRFTRMLMAQGLSARTLTQLISHLNDLLTERLVSLTAAAHGLQLNRACWLAFGSEGRSEQTIATDQDNGLVFESADPDADRPAWLAMAREVNEALAECGVPLCPGNVMASNPACCLTANEWVARFDRWMEHGAPEDLLNASIYFDCRPLAGHTALAAPLREWLVRRAPQLPRFMKQMAGNALRNRPPLAWHGGIATHGEAGNGWVDLKLNGTTIFVDAARLYALAHGINETSTRRRFEALAGPLHAGAAELQSWIDGFEALQMLRLRAQVSASAAGDDGGGSGNGNSIENPNRIALTSLSTIDRLVLKEAFRAGRTLQRRLALDYER